VRFTANVGFLFTELPFLERFAAARDVGFDAVEFAWPTASLAEVRAAVAAAGLRVGQLNMPAGDLAAGERGYPNDPARTDEWREDFGSALRLARDVDCPSINVLAGNAVPGSSRPEQLGFLRFNLSWALARREARTLLLEILNPTDTPDYLLTDVDAAVSLIERIGNPGLKLQFDTYHLASIGEDVVSLFPRLAPMIGHVQLADFPGRGAPGTGSIDFDAFFAAVARSGYDGCIGLEYLPKGATAESLAWLPREDRAWSDS
jgi:hydroxypyruvate isomerase